MLPQAFAFARTDSDRMPGICACRETIAERCGLEVMLAVDVQFEHAEGEIEFDFDDAYHRKHDHRWGRATAT